MVEQKTKMESEILEQNQIVPHILAKYIDSNTGEIKLNLPLNIKKIVLVASGSSYHCARFAVDLVEKISKIETRAIYSSEFLLKSLIPKDDDTLYIFITQSGETSDTLKSVERVNKETSLPTLCITNNENSSIWQSCDYKVACEAGEEIGIAATKSFTSQMLCLILISLKLIENNGDNSILEFKNTLKTIPEIINKAIAKRDDIKLLAQHLAKENIIILTADGISYSLAKEGALKIKETSYINTSAAILGEFMHGHVAVLNNKATLIYVAVESISERSISNLNKIKEEYSPNLVIIGKQDERIIPDYSLKVECQNIIQQLFANVVMLQLLALEIALQLNRNVDNPRGLHKVVVDNTI